jgi:hypothetical protein
MLPLDGDGLHGSMVSLALFWMALELPNLLGIWERPDGENSAHA